MKDSRLDEIKSTVETINDGARRLCKRVILFSNKEPIRVDVVGEDQKSKLNTINSLTSNFNAINSSLRRGGGDVHPKHRDVVEAADRLTNTNSINSETLHRGFTERAHKLKFKEGQEYSDPAFGFTSKNENTAHLYGTEEAEEKNAEAHENKKYDHDKRHVGVMLHYHDMKGRPGWDNDEFFKGVKHKASDHEQVVLPRGSKFKIHKIEKKPLNFDLGSGYPGWKDHGASNFSLHVHVHPATRKV